MSHFSKGRVIELDSLRELITEKPFRGWGEDPKKVEAVIRDDPECLTMFREAMKHERGGDHTSEEGKANCNNVTDGSESVTGNSRSYTLSRLERDAPELFEAVCNGEMSANIAAIRSRRCPVVLGRGCGVAVTEDDRIQSTPRASKDPQSHQYARQMVYVLKTMWERAQFCLSDWDKELAEARQNEIWRNHKPAYRSLEELLSAELGIGEADVERKKSEIIRQLREENPDWTQQEIADEVGCSQQYVNEITSKEFESNLLLVMPDHIKGKESKADFRKLPSELQDKVREKDISLNAACIEAGIRKQYTHAEKCVREFRKALVKEAINFNGLTDAS